LRSNPLFNSGELCLKIGLYFDDWQSVNPLGTARKSHKISAFYWTLLKLPAQYRSALHTVQEALLAKYEDIRSFGMQAVLRPLMADIALLEHEGVFVEALGDSVRGSIAYISADNLAAHGIGGFMESFGPNVGYFCRISYAQSGDINDGTKHISSYELRMADNYNADANRKMPNCTGVKHASRCTPICNFFMWLLVCLLI
jgi:hypothetical protein